MNNNTSFLEGRIRKHIRSPIAIQTFLDSIPYDPEIGTKSPRRVLSEQSANCFEGALFASAALRILGHKPLIVDLLAKNDDDHVIAVYKQNNHWGAVSKSNFSVLKAREPVYRTIRELVMSYFDFYFNTDGEKTLIAYSNPVNLSRFDKNNWTTTDENLDYIGDYLGEIKHHPVLTAKMKRELSKASPQLIRAGTLDSNPDGLYTP